MGKFWSVFRLIGDNELKHIINIFSFTYFHGQRSIDKRWKNFFFYLFPNSLAVVFSLGQMFVWIIYYPSFFYDPDSMSSAFMHENAYLSKHFFHLTQTINKIKVEHNLKSFMSKRRTKYFYFNWDWTLSPRIMYSIPVDIKKDISANIEYCKNKR